MSDAPERIWAERRTMPLDPAENGYWEARNLHDHTMAEYTRSDLIPAMIAAAKEEGRIAGLVSAARAVLTNCHDDMTRNEEAATILDLIHEPAQPDAKATHRHIKRGSLYREIGRGKVQTDTHLTDYAEVVVYQGVDDGLIWVRPVSEFEDGRFEVVS